MCRLRIDKGRQWASRTACFARRPLTPLGRAAPDPLYVGEMASNLAAAKRSSMMACWTSRQSSLLPRITTRLNHLVSPRVRARCRLVRAVAIWLRPRQQAQLISWRPGAALAAGRSGGSGVSPNTSTASPGARGIWNRVGMRADMACIKLLLCVYARYYELAPHRSFSFG